MSKRTEEITQDEIKEIIEQMVTTWGSQRKLADHLGISAAFLSDIINGNKPVSNQVAQKLGYKKVVKYAKDGSIE
jgi:plasmid maintenance system antidote protein VapI